MLSLLFKESCSSSLVSVIFWLQVLYLSLLNQDLSVTCMVLMTDKSLILNFNICVSKYSLKVNTVLDGAQTLKTKFVGCIQNISFDKDRVLKDPKIKYDIIIVKTVFTNGKIL